MGTKILNIGSLNIDYTYQMEHFIRPGETLAADALQQHLGGKGFNQSAALGKAGAAVFHAGHIGKEGRIFLEEMARMNVDGHLVTEKEIANGHAIIQVDPNGENCIIIFGGANRVITEADVDSYLRDFSAGDVLLTQNETSCRDYAITEASKKGMKVALNPSPITEDLVNSPALSDVDWFILNETEGNAFTGETLPEAILRKMHERFPKAKVLLTLGGEGCVYQDEKETVYQPVFRTKVVDTTGAGDTFTGFFLASVTGGLSVSESLKLASKAASIAISRPGAAEAVPTLAEVKEALNS